MRFYMEITYSYPSSICKKSRRIKNKLEFFFEHMSKIQCLKTYSIHFLCGSHSYNNSYFTFSTIIKILNFTKRLRVPHVMNKIFSIIFPILLYSFK